MTSRLVTARRCGHIDGLRTAARLIRMWGEGEALAVRLSQQLGHHARLSERAMVASLLPDVPDDAVEARDVGHIWRNLLRGA